MKTKVINLYGGPGTGKSTSAALLYAFLKLGNKNAELVREYVKDWAWDNRKPGEFDQFYIMGKQMRRESMLYGKVDWIVTDSPVMLSAYYGNLYSPKDVAAGVEHAVDRFYRNAKRAKIQHFHVFLERTKAYNPAGRFQTEEQARKIDGQLQRLLNKKDFTLYRSGTRMRNLIELLAEIGLDDDAIADIFDQFEE